MGDFWWLCVLEIEVKRKCNVKYCTLEGPPISLPTMGFLQNPNDWWWPRIPQPFFHLSLLFSLFNLCKEINATNPFSNHEKWFPWRASLGWAMVSLNFLDFWYTTVELGLLGFTWTVDPIKASSCGMISLYSQSTLLLHLDFLFFSEDLLMGFSKTDRLYEYFLFL